jgi:hypothetical protein
MTLKEKFLNSNCEKGYVNLNKHRAENNVKIADEFAIGFAEWCLDENHIILNDGKELLEIYKKEKGL